MFSSKPFMLICRDSLRYGHSYCNCVADPFAVREAIRGPVYKGWEWWL